MILLLVFNVAYLVLLAICYLLI